MAFQFLYRSYSRADTLRFAPWLLNRQSGRACQIFGFIHSGFVTLDEMPLKNPSRPRRKGPPPGETGQELLYLRFLSEKQVPVTVKLRDGEAVYGWIEYFDDRMIRLTREGKPNLFIYKDQIRTISESFRNIEARRRERNRSGKDRTAALPAADASIVSQIDGMPQIALLEAENSSDGNSISANFIDISSFSNGNVKQGDS
jgi:host factor-I protein